MEYSLIRTFVLNYNLSQIKGGWNDHWDTKGNPPR